MRLFKQGLTDKQVSERMSQGARQFTIHSIRSYRGRVERAGTLKRGLSGSSKERSEMSRRIKRQQWSRKAELRLIELHYAGFKPRRVARMLYKEGLRASNHPGAVGDRVSFLKRTGKIKVGGPQAPLPLPPSPSPRIKEVSKVNRVELIPRIGANESFTLSDGAYVEVLNICNREKFLFNE
jgi:hypothetical protein